MEMFKDLLLKVIRENDSSISQISRQTGISRSVLSRFITRGEGVGQSQLLESVLKVLPRCDYTTQRELYKALQNEEMELRYGKKAWNCMEEVKNLLSIRYPTMKLKIKQGFFDYSENQIIMGKAKVRSAIKTLFSELSTQEKIEISFWGTAQEELFYDLFMSIDKQSVHIKHLLTMVSGADNEYSLYNLRCIESVMPCLCLSDQYEARAFYVENIPISIEGPFSFFILTSHVAVGITGDYEGMQLICEEKMVHFYRDIFEKKYEQGQNLVKREVGMQQWQQYAIEMKKKQQTGYAILGSVPVEDASLMFDILKEAKVYVSKEIEENVSRWLKSFKEKTAEMIQIQVVNEHSFTISPGLILYCPSESIAFFSYEGENGRLIKFSLCNIGITKWMYRFLESLPNSGWLYE